MEISTFFYLLGFFGFFLCIHNAINDYIKDHSPNKKLKSEKSNQDFDDKLKPM